MPLHTASPATGSFITPQETTSEVLIRDWYVVNKRVKAVCKNNQLIFSVIEHSQEILIPAFDVVGLPKITNVAQLIPCLSQAIIQLSCFVEGGYKLAIQWPLKGGGQVITDVYRLWPRSIVPYEIDENIYPLNTPARKLILEAIEKWNNSATGFRFIPRTTQEDVLVFGEDLEPDDFYVGYKGGVQYIGRHLFQTQFTLSSIMREIGRVIGLYPEHQRKDRNQYVSVSGQPQREDRLGPQSQGILFGLYDFGSIMHYPIHCMLDNGQWINLIAPLSDDLTMAIGHMTILSEQDIKAARYLVELQRIVPNSLPRAAAAPSAAYSVLITNTEENLSISLSREPEWKRLQEKGDEYFKIQAYTKAFIYYHTLLKEYDGYIENVLRVELHGKCGKSCYLNQEYYLAITCYQRALEFAPGNSYLYYDLGQCYEALRKYEEAIKCYENALKIVPLDRDALCRAGACRFHLGQYNKAMRYYKKALAVDIRSAELHNKCAICYGRMKDYRSADIYYRRAIEIDPRNKLLLRNYHINLKLEK